MGWAWVALLWGIYGASRPWEMDGAGVADIPFPLSLEGVFYFTLGLFLRERPVRLNLPGWCGVGLLACGMALFWLTAWAELRGLPWFAYPRWVGIQATLLGAWGVVPGRAWPRGVTTFSFPLFVLHPFVTRPMGLLPEVVPELGWLRTEIAGLVISFAFAVAASWVGFVCLRRFLPRFSAVAFGGRYVGRDKRAAAGPR